MFQHLRLPNAIMVIMEKMMEITGFHMIVRI